MNIRIIKNTEDGLFKMIYDGSLLKIQKEPSDVNGISKCRYYVYDIQTNIQKEILPDIPKYDLVKLKDIYSSKDYLCFCTVDDIFAENAVIKIIKYDFKTEEYKVLYEFGEYLEKYLSYMKTKIFMVNEDFLIVQNEFLRSNLTEDFEGYFDFELHLFSVKENKEYKIKDENLNVNGISDIIAVTENVCVIKTGFDLFEDERYNKLSKQEVSVEGISFVNIGQLVSDMMIMKDTIVLDTIEQTYFDSTIPYLTKKDDYIIYSKVNFEKKEEEIVFYNYGKKESMICINKNVLSKNDMGNPYVIAGYPYMMNKTQKGIDFYNIDKTKIDINFAPDVNILDVAGEFVIVSDKVKGWFGKEKEQILVYKYPLMNVVHSEKGFYKGCLSKSSDELYVLINEKNGGENG